MIAWRRVCSWFYVRGFDPERYRVTDAIHDKKLSRVINLSKC
jgi:hypothetical protein